MAHELPSYGPTTNLDSKDATEEPDNEQSRNLGIGIVSPPEKVKTMGILMATPASRDGHDDAADSCATGIEHDVDAVPPRASVAVMNTPVDGTVAVGAKDVTVVGFGVAAPLAAARRAPVASDPA